jgi:hypothetical protein
MLSTLPSHKSFQKRIVSPDLNFMLAIPLYVFNCFKLLLYQKEPLILYPRTFPLEIIESIGVLPMADQL